LAENLDLLRALAGLSFDELAGKVKLDKTNVLDHINKGTKPRLGNLLSYVRVFNNELGCSIDVEDLKLSPSGLRDRVASTRTPPLHHR
jgi:hypothetical protein